MPTLPSPAHSAASRANCTRHGLHSDPFAHLPDQDRAEFAELHAAVTCDWGPRDAYERRWVMELVTAYWRQDRLRGLELAALTAAADERPPTEATLKRLATFARYGARIDKDIAKALQALRALRNRPDDWLDEPQECTAEPEPGMAAMARTPEPDPAQPLRPTATNASSPRTAEPEPPAPPQPPVNRHQRRRLEALARQAGRRAA